MEPDAVEVIREGLRELASNERRVHRAIALNRNRVALGDGAEDSSFTTDFVVERGKALKRKALPVKDYGRLQNALIQSEEHVNAFLKVDNVLFALTRDLSGKNPSSQLLAASCCCNLALGNAKACSSLAKSVAPYLIAELESLNCPLLDVCAWTIGNLVSGSDKAFEILHAQGGFKYLTSLIRSCDSTVLPSAAYAAVRYLRTGFKCISEDEMAELARATAERDLSYDDPYFVWLLALLSSNAACNVHLYARIPMLIDYLHSSRVNNFADVSEATATVRILGNSVCESSGRVALLVLENSKYSRRDLETLFDQLLSHRYAHLRKETLWLIGNLYNHESGGVQGVIKNILPSLLHLELAEEFNNI